MPLIGIDFKFCSVFEDAKDYYHDYTRKERAGTPSRKTPKDVEGKSHLEGETESEKDNQRTQKNLLPPSAFSLQLSDLATRLADIISKKE